MTSIFDPAQPVHNFKHANAAKAEAAVVHVLASGKPWVDHSDLYATLFLAEARHFAEHHRPIYGDTWARTDNAPLGALTIAAVHGLDTKGRILRRGFNLGLAKTSAHARLAEAKLHREWLGPSAMGALDGALAIMDEQGNSASRVHYARNLPLHGTGRAGTLIDWRDGLVDPHRTPASLRRVAELAAEHPF